MFHSPNFIHKLYEDGDHAFCSPLNSKCQQILYSLRNIGRNEDMKVLALYWKNLQ